MPSEEMQLARLTDEAGGIVAAALETTKRSVCVMLFYVLSDPSILNNLRRELSPIMPDSTKLPNVSELEKLPYLMAVIQEGMFSAMPLLSETDSKRSSSRLRYGGSLTTYK
jgi:cytochrome P450